jgi:hypothetical protein
VKSKLTIILLLFVELALAQQTKTLELCFSASYEIEPIKLNDSRSFISSKDSIEISTLKFYCSNITLLNDGKKVWEEKNSYHLIDIAKNQYSHLNLTVPKTIIYKEVTFNLGIDSITNEMGSMGGDLDPTKGMYWAWNSGYINFKLEGKSAKCKTRNNEFQFHIGGYSFPYNTLQAITLPINNTEKINVNLDVTKFLSNINLADENHIMSPSAKALIMAQNIAKSFSVK